MNVNRVLNSVTSTCSVGTRKRPATLNRAVSFTSICARAGTSFPTRPSARGLISTIGRDAQRHAGGELPVPLGGRTDERVRHRDGQGWGERAHTVAGILGGGVKFNVSPRWGIRLDARVSLSKNTARTALDATPNVVMGGLPAGRFLFLAPTTIMFSNSTLPCDGARRDCGWSAPR